MEEYESLEKRHLEVETTVYAEERLEELRQENKDLDEAFAEERQRLEDLQQEYEKVVDELEELKESRDIDMLDTERTFNSNSTTRSQLLHLQNQYDALLQAHNTTQKERKDDARRWIEMKTKMDGEMRKLKSALKREKEKNALLAGADGTGDAKKKPVDENSADRSRSVKAVAAGKKDNTTGTGSTRAPLRSIFTGSQGVEEGPKREEADPAGRVEVQNSRQPVASARASDARQSAVRLETDQTPNIALQLLDVFAEWDKPSGLSATHSRSEATGKRIDKPSSSRAEERERTIANEVLDTPPVRRTSKVERIQEIQDDIGGSTTEEDEEPHDAVMRERPEPSLLRLGERRSLHAPRETLRLGNHPTRVEEKSNTRTTGPHTPVISVNTARTTNIHISKATHTAETPNAASSRPPTSIARTGSRVTRTPSGMQWLGGEKTKLTRRDSFEDEVGTSSRVKPPQAEVVHTLPRAMPVKASLAISTASTSKLPAMKRLVGRPEDGQQTPTRASHAPSLKRKDMIQLETLAGPSSTLTGTAGRSEKRQKLTATSSRRLEDTNQEEIYVINPDRNQGKNYTFHSVQRNKEQRRCMHGEACEGCDNWYEATKDIQPDGGIQFGRYSPTPSQLIEEDQEELAQARKQKIMNNVSRHKVEHEKNPTPPGYW
ncbi:hypothetical protein FFLO_02937 [Filobasidium floriforme]|uniref:DNA endonuclease activator Ctp1 C-terminal domain-containing protein n=1 Tax=Filobasidium floriforme TaxID=5210 RepID=A0A8K0NRC2_9TREE|nr:hypothetical protein FFLO_02937 [Filobasidium floriforme]